MNIEFRNITFKYKEENIFTNFNLQIKENDLAYLIGLNNSGKSTIIKLLRNYPCIGDILFDGIELNQKNYKSISSCCSIIDEENLNSISLDDLKKCFGYNDEDYNKLDIKSPQTFMDIIKLNIYYSLINNKYKFIVIDDLIDYLNSRDKMVIYELIKKRHKQFKKTILVCSNNAYGMIYFKRILVLDKGIIKFDGTLKKISEIERVFDELGIYMPFIVDLSIKLKLYNLIDKIYTDNVKLVNDIWKEKKK